MSEAMTLKETTQHELSGLLVAVGNIWARDLADEGGKVASRMSAVLSIREPNQSQGRQEKVFAGSRVTLGADTYCVETVTEGSGQPGHLVLRKL